MKTIGKTIDQPPAETLPVDVPLTDKQWATIASTTRQITAAIHDKVPNEVAQNARLLLQVMATINPSRSRPDFYLSDRDAHVLWLMSLGFSNSEIANHLHISVEAVTRTLLSKLGAHNPPTR